MKLNIFVMYHQPNASFITKGCMTQTLPVLNPFRERRENKPYINSVIWSFRNRLKEYKKY